MIQCETTKEKHFGKYKKNVLSKINHMVNLFFFLMKWVENSKSETPGRITRTNSQPSSGIAKPQGKKIKTLGTIIVTRKIFLNATAVNMMKVMFIFPMLI